MKKYFFVILILLFPSSLFAAMSSSSYRIDSDVIGAAGNQSASSSYGLGDTLGEPIIGESSGASYQGKFGFWYMTPGGSQLGLSCEASNVYMVDYTLGDIDNYSKYLFSSSEECVVTDNSSAPWTLTSYASNFTSSKNNLPSSSVYLVTDGTAGGGDTITSPVTNITEASGPESSLDSVKTVISGNASASGTYYNRPSIELKNLNTLYNEGISGEITVTLQ